MTSDFRAYAPSSHITSPCTGVCKLDMSGYCVGCRRSGSEIARWVAMDEDERVRIIDEVLPRRAAQGWWPQ